MVNETANKMSHNTFDLCLQKMINIKNSFQMLSFTLLLVASQVTLAIEIKATVDRSPVNINESFQIIFTMTESPNGQPDFSPLEKDFTILNRSQQSNSSFVNGQRSATIKWVLSIMAKNEGQLAIPAISFGSDTSYPTVLLVNKSSSQKANIQAGQNLFLDVEVDSTTPYVQSQIVYTLRFYQKVQITQASLSEPELEKAIVEKLGEDKVYETDVNGIGYRVTERRYAIFPQQSGSVTIKPLALRADVVTGGNQSRFNGFFNRTRTKTQQVFSKAITLDVKAAPVDFTGAHWIPAEHVFLEEKWSGDVSKMKVGEPLTRTLILFAKGTTVAQLPELYIEENNPQLKTYPDQPVLKEQKKEEYILALREEKIAYIPSKAGTYQIPAVEIPWFNTQSKTMEVAGIPATTITAMGGASQPSTVPLPTEINATHVGSVTQVAENPFWMWFSLFLSIGWLVTLFFLFKKANTKQEAVAVKKDNSKAELKEALNAIRLACRNSNKVAAKNALVEWGRIRFKSNNLSDISSHCNAHLKCEIFELNEALYANQTVSWNGQALLAAFTENNARETLAGKVDDKLEPLYKI